MIFYCVLQQKMDCSGSMKKILVMLSAFIFLSIGVFILCNSYKKPQIYDIDSTIKLLREGNKSIARFGDGELVLIKGGDLKFERASKELSFRLKEVLSSAHENIMIGIPSELYSTKGLHKSEEDFWSKYRSEFLPLLKKHLNMSQIYAPTNISHLSRKITDKSAVDNYFKKVRTIWQDKDIHLIYGKGIFDGFKYDIFDNAKSITYQIAPNKYAFEEYDNILAEALKVDKNKLIIIILGPTATVLAYDLGLHGYQALDMGHIAKSYEWYKRDAGDFGNYIFWLPD